MTTLLLQLLLQAVLILLNAIFACAEIAILSVNKAKMSAAAEKGDKRAIRLTRLTERPAGFLATIQVAITLSGFLGSAFAADNFASLLVDQALKWGWNVNPAVLNSIAVVVVTLILSYFTLVFGELVPKRLAMNSLVENPMAAFGVVSGMVFPILMFPACILFGLAELLIPELARCAAAGSETRIRYLVKRSLKVALLYGLIFGGLMVLLAEPLCLKLYNSPDAGKSLKFYALLVPMLYCDALTDAMTKGLGQQAVCVRYNILTSAMDVVFLYLLLPRYGMEGYFVSFLITHLVNFGLSLRRLLKISGVSLPFYIPTLSLAAAMTAVLGASRIAGSIGQCIAYCALLGSLLYLCRVIGREDIYWLFGLLKPKK